MNPFSTLVNTMGTAPIPSADPLGFPLPVILLQILAYFTLALHFLAVNFTLGGLLYLIWTKFKKGEGSDTASIFLGKSLPLGFSYLVTLGIPPLLFVQVMYGQLFYSSSVVIGAFWIMVVPLLICAYGLLYLNKLKKDNTPKVQLIILGIAALCMLFVGFIYVNNITLSVTPDAWLEKYANRPDGVNLNLGEPTLFARYALFMSPTLVVAGAALVLAGTLLSKWKTEDKGAPLTRLGLKGHIIGRVIMAAAAGGMFATIPSETLSKALNSGTLFLVFGIVLAVIATGLIALSVKTQKAMFSVISFLVMTLEVSMFIVLRDLLRQEYLAPHFKLTDVPVQDQWGMFIIFLVSMVIGLAFLIVLTTKVVQTAVKSYKQAE